MRPRFWIQVTKMWDDAVPEVLITSGHGDDQEGKSEDESDPTNSIAAIGG